jgi:hypothetical protein
MPCDQRITTSVVELAKSNRKRLEAVLTEAGWTVYTQGDTLRAYGPGDVTLVVTPTEAAMTASRYVDTAPVLTRIRQAYAAKTVAEVSKRFGFKVAGTKKLQGGAKRLLLRR